ncbi:hypothetical protein [Georgenia sp. SUBG003]|uniref:hypothetical protein n=1 Tax=Georgenia sp. SUBG003 TaxID=1497974 RepID=UPI003AB4E914
MDEVLAERLGGPDAEGLGEPADVGRAEQAGVLGRCGGVVGHCASAAGDGSGAPDRPAPDGRPDGEGTR